MQDASIIFDNILSQSLKAPGAKVSRADFLSRSLKYYCLDDQIERAVSSSVKDAEIQEEVLDRVSSSIIKQHTYKVTGVSTLSGMPGGLAMVATIPADLAHYYYHVVVLAQKLAYLYGYPQFNSGRDEVHEELVSQLTLFIGVMYDVEGANRAVLAASGNRAAEPFYQVPQKTLTETTFYLLKKNIARWVGIKITKRTFSQGLSKAIPLIGGFISGGVAYTSFTPMAQKLKATLKEGYKSGLKSYKEGETIST